MLIKCVCKECMLTKKSIEYYEKKGLILPEIGKNNYRNYNENDIAVLKEISVLRKLGINISDIKIILESNNKVATLSKCKCLMELKLQKTKAQYNCIEHLITNYDIDKEIEYINDNINGFFTIKEKLLQSFPGTYGMYLCIHFGQFLNEKIDSKEKEIAYYKVVNFLDSVDNLNFSSELEEYLENCFSIMQKTDMVKMNNAMLNAVDNMDDYIENNKEVLEEYIKIRTSDDYKSTSPYKMQQLIMDFQQSSGYCDIFLANLRILSFSYREYTEKLQVANKVFLNKYPQTQDIYK
jgi:DNA-binding transcriptional MerR regulator